MPARCDALRCAALQWRCNIFAHMSNVKYILCTRQNAPNVQGIASLKFIRKAIFFVRSKLWDTFAQHPHNPGADASICNVFIFLDSLWWYVYLTWWTIIPNTLWIMSKHKLTQAQNIYGILNEEKSACMRTYKQMK